MTEFKAGDIVAVTRPDDSGTSCILSGYPALLVTRIDEDQVFLDTSAVPLLGDECFVYAEELDLVRRDE